MTSATLTISKKETTLAESGFSTSPTLFDTAQFDNDVFDYSEVGSGRVSSSLSPTNYSSSLTKQ